MDDGFGGEEGERGEGGEDVVEEFGQADGKENGDDKSPDPEVAAGVERGAGAELEVVPSGFGGTDDPGAETKDQNEGEVGKMEEPLDAVGVVAAAEASDVLLDNELLNERLGVGEVGGDIPGGDD